MTGIGLLLWSNSAVLQVIVVLRVWSVYDSMPLRFDTSSCSEIPFSAKVSNVLQVFCSI